MKKIINLFTTALVLNLLVLQILIKSPQISASTGLSVFPYFTEINVGSSYELNIASSFSEEKDIRIIPTLFEINTETESLTNLDTEIQKLLVSNINEFLSISKNNFTLNSGTTEKVQIKLEKLPPSQYLIGVRVEAKSTGNQSSSDTIAELASSISSVILTYGNPEEIINQVEAKIEINCGFSLFGICFGNEFTIRSEIKNNSFGFIKARGEVGVYDGQQKIGSFGLTQNLQKNIFPTKTEVVESRFVDSRGLFDRVGEIKFAQNVSVGEKSFYRENGVIVIPVEIFAGGVGLVIVTYLVIKGIRIKKK